MQFIDTHSHIYLPEFDSDRDAAVDRAVKSGVRAILMPNIDAGSLDSMLDTEKRYSGICFSMLGLHPTSVKEDYQKQLEGLENSFSAHNYIAVGEIGIDLYWDKTFIREQIIAFRRQLAFSLDVKLPVVIHSRESFPEVFAVLDEFAGRGLKGIMHAFSGTADDASRAVKMGLKLGIGGIVTFKNSGLDKALSSVKPEDLVLETDSPYLAPVPHRGKRNESSYICIINKKIADIYGMNEEETANVLYNNSASLFKL